MNIMSLIKQEEDLLGLWQKETTKAQKKNTENISLQNLEVDIDADVAEVVPKVIRVMYGNIRRLVYKR